MKRRLVLIGLPVAWLAGLMTVFQLSVNRHSWVWSVWGEQHPAWDLLTAAVGIVSAGWFGWELWDGDKL